MRRGTWGTSAVGAVALVSLLSACSPSAPVPRATGGEHAASSAPAPTAVAGVPVRRATPPAIADPDPTPIRLDIPSIDASLPIRPVGVQRDGSMEIPRDPAVAGWYRYGPAPGAAEGSAVLAAHVDSRVLGIGPLARLREMGPGQRIRVRDDAGHATTFTIASVEYIPRATLPVDTLFARAGKPTLVIITCGGSFDEATRSYSDNVVAVAHPEG